MTEPELMFRWRQPRRSGLDTYRFLARTPESLRVRAVEALRAFRPDPKVPLVLQAPRVVPSRTFGHELYWEPVGPESWSTCPERVEEMLAILGLDLIQEAAARFRQPT